MWILVCFDLPTETKKERKAASDFRKLLLKDGFFMFQYSVYMRPCPSMENTTVHVKRVRRWLPYYGKVSIFKFTDKQFGMMETFYGKKKEVVSKNPKYQQLTLF